MKGSLFYGLLTILLLSINQNTPLNQLSIHSKGHTCMVRPMLVSNPVVVYQYSIAFYMQVYPEGTHIMIPWFERPVIYDVRARPHLVESTSGSRDLQMVNLSVGPTFFFLFLRFEPVECSSMWLQGVNHVILYLFSILFCQLIFLV